MVLAQGYGGMIDGAQDGLQPGWINGEASVVRRFRAVRVQLGWRSALYGRHSTYGAGPVVAVWRGF
jgi:hypothetical protein